MIATGLVKRYGKGADSDATDTLIASTLKSQCGRGGGGIGPEETLVAAPLTKGSATGQGVNAPGRRHTNYVAGPLGGGNDGIGRRSEDDPNTVIDHGVRRLTPVECERLQGLPDDWTRLDARTPDSRRYSALGDAVTANVAEWLGCRLLAAHVRARAAALIGPAAGDGQPEAET